jgi:hypothetical protein
VRRAFDAANTEGHHSIRSSPIRAALRDSHAGARNRPHHRPTGAFLDLLRTRIPGILRSLERGFATDDLETAYGAVPAVDFSREILTPQSHRLLVVRDCDSGWTDLGTPKRVVEALTQNRVRPAWFAQAVECNLGGTNFEDGR